MKPSFWVAIVILVAGIVIVSWPDSNERVLSFSEAHGPSILDLAGLTFIIITWFWLLVKVFMRAKHVRRSVGVKGIIIAIGCILAGASLIASGLLYEYDSLLYSGIGLSAVGYLILVIPAFRIPK
jgi:drug/metabolite transporter (DMT)-like permease